MKNGKEWAPPKHWPIQDPKQYWPVASIRPYENNPRTHPPEQITLLSELILKHGPDQPIVVDEEKVILKGHGRRLAAIEGGLKFFTVVQRLGLSATEKTAMRIADNQVSLLSGWDRLLIRAQASELKMQGYDMKLLAFDLPTLGWLTSGDPVADANGEWAGMPHFSNPDAKAFRSIVVHFNDQAGVDAFAKKIDFKITEKTRFLHYPEVIIQPFVKYQNQGEKPGRRERKKAAAK
jgi:hypothetical protein